MDECSLAPLFQTARKQFRLGTMFVVVTLVAIFCGVAYWKAESGLHGFIRDVITGDWLPNQQ
jgi:uncharacterized protein (DUF2461 family)